MGEKMKTFENKEKNLNKLIDKLSSLSASYSQSNLNSNKISDERNQLEREKKDIENKHDKLLREHKYLKEKLLKLKEEVSNKSDLEEKFNQDIDELSKETEILVIDSVFNIIFSKDWVVLSSMVS